MKKVTMALCVFICAFTLVACSGQQTNEPLALGINAIITEIDETNKIITTKDSGEEGVLGDDCLIDCSQIPMIYCNYDTQDTTSISFDDLQVGDEIKFACVDGPEFDGHLVDFDQAMKRQQMYKTEEGRALLRYQEGATHHGGCGQCGGDK